MRAPVGESKLKRPIRLRRRAPPEELRPDHAQAECATPGLPPGTGDGTAVEALPRPLEPLTPAAAPVRRDPEDKRPLRSLEPGCPARLAGEPMRRERPAHLSGSARLRELDRAHESERTRPQEPGDEREGGRDTGDQAPGGERGERQSAPSRPLRARDHVAPIRLQAPGRDDHACQGPLEPVIQILHLLTSAILRSGWCAALSVAPTVSLLIPKTSRSPRSRGPRSTGGRSSRAAWRAARRARRARPHRPHGRSSRVLPRPARAADRGAACVAGRAPCSGRFARATPRAEPRRGSPSASAPR
jgi:hypothetical protein